MHNRLRRLAAMGLALAIVLALAAPPRSSAANAVTKAAAAAPADPVGERLDAAMEKYARAVAAYRQAVAEHLTAREEAARRKGDKAAVDAVKGDRTLFEEAGRMPPTLPKRVREELERAHKAVVAAYRQAVRDYTRARQDERASAAERELKRLTEGGPGAGVAAAAVPAAAPPVVRVDLFRRVDTTDKDMHRGPWAWEKDAVKSGGQPDQWLQVRYDPPAEYDLEVAFTRLEGNDIVALIFPVSAGRDTTMLYLGGYANKVMGLDAVDGKADGRNETDTRPPGGCLTNGHKYVVRVEVRRDAVRAFLDGDPIVSIDPRNRKFGVSGHWGAKPGLIGVATFRSPTAFHSATVVERPVADAAAAAAAAQRQPIHRAR